MSGVGAYWIPFLDKSCFYIYFCFTKPAPIPCSLLIHLEHDGIDFASGQPQHTALGGVKPVQPFRWHISLSNVPQIEALFKIPTFQEKGGTSLILTHPVHQLGLLHTSRGLFLWVNKVSLNKILTQAPLTSVQPQIPSAKQQPISAREMSHDPIPHISLAKLSSVCNQGVGTATPKSRQQNTMDPSHGDMGWPACSRYRCGPHSRHKCPFPRFPLHVPIINDRRPFHLHLKKRDMGKFGYQLDMYYITIVGYVLYYDWIHSMWVNCNILPSGLVWSKAILEDRMDKLPFAVTSQMLLQFTHIQTNVAWQKNPLVNRKNAVPQSQRSRNISKWDRIVGIHKNAIREVTHESSTSCPPTIWVNPLFKCKISKQLGS